MIKPAGFRLRLRIRIGKAFTTDATSLSVTIGGRALTIMSRKRDQPLSEAKWIVIGARGFATDDDAKDFGEQLRLAVEVAALCSRLGTDVGQDKPTSWVSEDFARSLGLLKPGQRIAPNIHGLTILPDDDKTRFPVMEAEGRVTSDPAQFLGAMSELAAEMPLNISAAASGIRLLNLALMIPQPLSQLVLAFSAVEALGQDESWTDAQAQLIEELASEVEEDAAGNVERLEVANALRRSLHRVGLRQGVLRVLSRLGLQHLRSEWDRLYGLRSGIFHGTLNPSEPEIHQLANETISLCGKIILALLEREGTKPPSIASTHFGKY